MQTRNAVRPLRVALRRAGAGLAIVVVGYGAAGMLGGAIPSNAGWREPAQGVRIFVASNGVHTDLILPKVAAGIDWRPLVKADHLRDPRYAGYAYAGFGWGDAKFYRETPQWRDVRPATIIAAALGSDATLAHVAHLPVPRVGRAVRTILLRPNEYRRLAAFIRGTVAPRPTHQFGYGDYDVFYTARGRYSAWRTCNAWTGDALRSAGVRVGAWTPFPVTVLGWFPLTDS